MFYNSDTYDVPLTNTVIAEIYFRLDSAQVTHKRVVFSFMDFVSSMGGIERVLLKICGLVYSGYAGFWSVFATLGFLYKLRSENTIFKTRDEDDLQLINIPLSTRIAVFYHQSCLAPCLRCCMTEKHKKIMTI